MFHFSSKPFKANPSAYGMDMVSEEFEEIDVAFQSPSEKSYDALIAIGGCDGSDDQLVIPIIIHIFYLVVAM